jgi:hypothetical protein
MECLGHRSGNEGEIPGLATARADAEAALRIAAAGIQTVGAEVMAALVAAQQTLACEALFAVVADGELATLHQVQPGAIDEWRFAGEIQGNHGKSIET